MSSPRGRRRCSIPPKRALLDSIDNGNVAGLRDRSLIALMVYSFARIGAALGMTVEDVFTQNRRLWVRLREKGGRRHAMPCHHNLEEYLIAYLDGAGLRDDPKGRCFAPSGAAPAGLLKNANLIQKSDTDLSKRSNAPNLKYSICARQVSS
jgi:integrase